jgi:hypothetical protein
LGSSSIRLSTAGSNFDTVIAVWRGTDLDTRPPIGWTMVDCNNDSSGAQAELSFAAAPGHYFIQVGGASGATGNLVLTASCDDDQDCDSVLNAFDNCPSVWNGDQRNDDLASPSWAWLSDATGNRCDADDDNDGCADIREGGSLLSKGGQRSRSSPWDFADVPAPALPAAATRNKAITLQDVGAALSWVGRSTSNGTSSGGQNYQHDTNTNGVVDGMEYDRTPAGSISGPPNGAITLSDVGVILAQVGHSCL